MLPKKPTENLIVEEKRENKSNELVSGKWENGNAARQRAIIEKTLKLAALKINENPDHREKFLKICEYFETNNEEQGLLLKQIKALETVAFNQTVFLLLCRHLSMLKSIFGEQFYENLINDISAYIKNNLPGLAQYLIKNSGSGKNSSHQQSTGEPQLPIILKHIITQFTTESSLQKKSNAHSELPPALWNVLCNAMVSINKPQIETIHSKKSDKELDNVEIEKNTFKKIISLNPKTTEKKWKKKFNEFLEKTQKEPQKTLKMEFITITKKKKIKPVLFFGYLPCPKGVVPSAGGHRPCAVYLPKMSFSLDTAQLNRLTEQEAALLLFHQQGKGFKKNQRETLYFVLEGKKNPPASWKAPIELSTAFTGIFQPTSLNILEKLRLIHYLSEIKKVLPEEIKKDATITDEKITTAARNALGHPPQQPLLKPLTENTSNTDKKSSSLKKYQLSPFAITTITQTLSHFWSMYIKPLRDNIKQLQTKTNQPMVNKKPITSIKGTIEKKEEKTEEKYDTDTKKIDPKVTEISQILNDCLNAFKPIATIMQPLSELVTAQHTFNRESELANNSFSAQENFITSLGKIEKSISNPLSTPPKNMREESKEKTTEKSSEKSQKKINNLHRANAKKQDNRSGKNEPEEIENKEEEKEPENIENEQKKESDNEQKKELENIENEKEKEPENIKKSSEIKQYEKVKWQDETTERKRNTKGKKKKDAPLNKRKNTHRAPYLLCSTAVALALTGGGAYVLFFHFGVASVTLSLGLMNPFFTIGLFVYLGVLATCTAACVGEWLYRHNSDKAEELPPLVFFILMPALITLGLVGGGGAYLFLWSPTLIAGSLLTTGAVLAAVAVLLVAFAAYIGAAVYYEKFNTFKKEDNKVLKVEQYTTSDLAPVAHPHNVQPASVHNPTNAVVQETNVITKHYTFNKKQLIGNPLSAQSPEKQPGQTPTNKSQKQQRESSLRTTPF